MKSWVQGLPRDYFVVLSRDSALRLWKAGDYPEWGDDSNDLVELAR